MPDAFLTLHAARAYGVPAALVTKVLAKQCPFPLPKTFLDGCKFSHDPSTPEHNSYLVARWVAHLKAAGKSDTEVLDTMCGCAAVAWKRPWWYRILTWIKAQWQARFQTP